MSLVCTCVHVVVSAALRRHSVDHTVINLLYSIYVLSNILMNAQLKPTDFGISVLLRHTVAGQMAVDEDTVRTATYVQLAHLVT